MVRTDNEKGGSCLHEVPTALWNLEYGGPPDHFHLDVAYLLARVADNMKLGIKSFVREFGPSASGTTICGVEFTSEDSCVACGDLHTEPYRIAAIEFKTQRGTGTKLLLYTPCQDRGREVQRGAQGPRRLTDSELESIWRDDAKTRFLAAAARLRRRWRASSPRIRGRTRWLRPRTLWTLAMGKKLELRRTTVVKLRPVAVVLCSRALSRAWCIR